MIISCESCSTRFKVPDERVTTKGTKVRCSKCTHVFVVFPDGEQKKEVQKKTTLQFRAGAVEAAVAGHDEKFKKRVTETFDMPPASSARVSPFQTGGSTPPSPASSPPTPIAPTPLAQTPLAQTPPRAPAADPFASASLPTTAADPFSGASASAPATPSSATGPKKTGPLISSASDPFSGPPTPPPPSQPSPPASPFGANDPFGSGGPSSSKPTSDPFSTPPSPPPDGAAASKDLFVETKNDPFGIAAPSGGPARAADPFASASLPVTPSPTPATPAASDPFGGAPDPFASTSGPPKPTADPFAGGGGASAPPPIPSDGASPFGPPINFGGDDDAPKSDPMHRPPSPPPGSGADPFAAISANPMSSPMGGESALDGLFDDAVAASGPPPVPMGAKPITDPFEGTAADARLGNDMADEAGAFDGGGEDVDGDGDSPPRQNFQAETKIYSVPHELREASMPGSESPPQPVTTTSLPIPPSIWRNRARLVASTTWQIVVLAVFMFAALVWARGGTVDDVLEGRAISVITRGTVNVIENSGVSISDVQVTTRTSESLPNLAIVTGEVQNLTDSPIRGVAVKVSFGNSAAPGPFYGWAGEGIDPVTVSLSTSTETIAEIAAQPIATTIAPGAKAPFAVLAPNVPMGAVARVSAKPQSVALPLPSSPSSPSVTIPIEIDASPSPKAPGGKKRGSRTKRPRP